MHSVAPGWELAANAPSLHDSRFPEGGSEILTLNNKCLIEILDLPGLEVSHELSWEKTRKQTVSCSKAELGLGLEILPLCPQE